MTSLQVHHTFATAVGCKQLIEIYSEQNIFEFLINDDDRFMILGGGSNVLFTEDFNGTVLLNRIKGIEVVDEDKERLLVSAGSGEQWHNFVMWSVSHGLWGIENLALIPGTVGAAPMQNIGAYGVEQDKVFHSLEAVDLMEGTRKVFYKEECEFGYRESYFKRAGKGKYFITRVNYLLSKIPDPVVSYADLSGRLGSARIEHPKQIASVVMDIRTQKLPDPEQIGNAGSFFKNPVISMEKYESLKEKYPQLASYPAGEHIKLAAGWLIDQCGYKGMRKGNTGTYPNQALVIVNNGGASGQEIYAFAKEVQASVLNKFGVSLEMEVNIISP